MVPDVKLKLILMRHAKSSWGSPGLADHDRPLNERGQRSATLLGNWLRKNEHIPDELIESIYQATGNCALIVAHNPGIGDLALRISRMLRDVPNHTRFGDFPTGSTFVIEYDADSWQDIDFSQGRILDFIIPRELEK